MAVLAAVLAGEYSAAWNSVSIGQQQDGLRLRLSFSKEEVKSASYGDMVIDSVYKGGNCYLQGIFIEMSNVIALSAVSVFNPYCFGQGGTYSIGNSGVIGRFDFNLAKALALTAVGGHSFASSIATLTASRAIIDKDLTTEILFANRQSVLNVTFRLYPFLNTSDAQTIRWFVVT